MGCPKNDVDADYLTARLVAEGHQPVIDPNEAESILVNTCGFILQAKEESIHELLRFAGLKQSGELKTLYATGCLSQRHGDELLDGLPELDGAFGIGELDAVADAVTAQKQARPAVFTEAARLDYLDWKSRWVDENIGYAYIKISDGCERCCAYCSIPQIRGEFRSRPIESIVQEAEFLAGRGKKELILVSQDATMYGHEDQQQSHPPILSLLRHLEEIDALRWIRLMYLHPAGLSDALINYMADDNKTLPYFDLPLQHINDTILSSMRRGIDRAGIERLIGNIRSSSSLSAIRTTLIVGLPGETQAYFDELRDFVVEQRFDRMGVFSYSQEEGTAAAELPDQVPAEVRYRRLDQLMTIQQEIAFEKNISLIGETRDIIIDSIQEDGLAIGRTYADCPDVDQEVKVKGGAPRVGDILQVRITASEGYDLEGTVVEG